MRIPTHLRLSRHGVYYFRIVVPKTVRPAFGGRREIKASLGTRNLKVALVEARRFAIEAYESFAKVEGLMSVKNPVDPSDRSTWPTEADRLGKFETTIETPTPYGIERFHAKADPNNPADIAAAKEATLDYMAKLETRRIVPKTPEQAAYLIGQDDEIAALVAQTLANRGMASPDAPAAAENKAIEQPRAATRPIPKVESSNFLMALWPRFILHKKKSSLKTERSEKAYKAKFDMFIAWHGDCHIADVTPEDISHYKDYLLAEHKPQAGKNQNIAGLDSTTVDNYVGVLNGFYKWARSNGMFPRDMLAPTTDQRITSKAEKKKRAQSGKINRAFKTDELIKAFDAKTYRAENTLSHHFWPPLIALFTGMRLGEVSQLAFTDIVMEDGRWAISINDEDYKKVKSAASRRLIPMHPELLALDLPQFAADVKTLNLGPQLFPVLRTSSGGDMGNAPGKKWDRYLTAVGLTDDALTYHSFRRTASTLLKKKKVPFDVRCQMVGHDLDHVNELYSTDYTVEDLAEMIFPKFVFEGLDLSALKYQRGEFNQSILDGHAAALEDEARRARDKERDAERDAKT